MQTQGPVWFALSVSASFLEADFFAPSARHDRKRPRCELSRFLIDMERKPLSAPSVHHIKDMITAFSPKINT